jgi:hypothetical protein
MESNSKRVSKPSGMKTNSTQQEILLITGTSFASRQWCGKDGTGKNNPLSEKDQLEEACWYGLVKEMLPELFVEPGSSKNLFLWQIREAASFLELDFGEFPSEKDKFSSIDPYLFLGMRSEN